MGTLEASPLRAACLLHKHMLLWCTGAAVTIRLPPRNGVIDRHELKALLQSTDNGFQPVTLVRARLAVHLRATPVPSRPAPAPAALLPPAPGLDGGPRGQGNAAEV